MNALVVGHGRRELVVGALLGLYAAAIAWVPEWPAKAILALPLLALPLLWWMLRESGAWLTLFFFAALLLPPLPIALGDSGPHVAILFALAGLFVGMLRLPEWRIRIDGLAVSMLALCAVLLASVAMAAVNSGPVIATGSLARVVLFGISLYVFFFLRDGPARLVPAPFRWIAPLFWFAAGSALFAAVDFYYQFPAPSGYGAQFIWLDSGVFRRAQGFFYEASTLGNLCAFFLEMIAVALLRPRANRPLPLRALLAGGGALTAALVLSYSRASLLNVAIAMLVLLWLHRGRIRFRRLAIGLALFVGIAAIILTFAFPIFTRAYWQRVSVSAQFLFQSPDAVLSGRLQSWERLRDFLLAHPWYACLGVGYKTLPYSDFIGGTAIADNTYLSLLAETGVIGLACVLALNAAILTTAARASRSPDPQRSFCGTWMLCFWAGQTVQMASADLLTYWRVLPVYFCVLALAAREGSHAHSFA
jgi:O-antigen ligase